MIRTFKHKGIERLFRSGSRAGIQASHAARLTRQLSALDAASGPEDMNRPGWDCHPLKGNLSGQWSVNALVLMLVSSVVSGFTISSFWTAFFASIFISLFGLFISGVLF